MARRPSIAHFAKTKRPRHFRESLPILESPKDSPHGVVPTSAGLKLLALCLLSFVTQLSLLPSAPLPLIISSSSAGKDSSTTTASPLSLAAAESQGAKGGSQRLLAEMLLSEHLHWPIDYLLSLLKHLG